MAVYTPVTEKELKSFLAEYDLGALHLHQEIAEGIENTNYKVVTDAGMFILTLFEKRVNAGELPYYIGLMEHLRRRGIPCAHVMPRRDGRQIGQLRGKPAIFTSFLPGAWPRDITPAHCEIVGRTLAEFHAAGRDYLPKRRNTMGFAAWQSLIHASRDRAHEVDAGLFDMLDRELDHLEEKWPKGLPQGAIHADLFPDNVFFEKGKLSGVIDFYFACTDTFVYDLMLTLNPWCFDADGNLDRARSSALLAAYHQARPLSADEIAALPFFGAAAAVRIVATRLYDWLNPAQGALVRAKDPMEHVRILQFHQQAHGPADYGFNP